MDLVSDLVGRLLSHMQDKGATMVVPTLRPPLTDMPLRPFSDPENFNPGYVMRSQHILFKQGDREPWTHLLGHDQEREILPDPGTTRRPSTTESGGVLEPPVGIEPTTCSSVIIVYRNTAGLSCCTLTALASSSRSQIAACAASTVAYLAYLNRYRVLRRT